MTYPQSPFGFTFVLAVRLMAETACHAVWNRAGDVHQRRALRLNPELESVRGQVVKLARQVEDG